MYNYIFRGHSWLGDVRVAEADCVRIEGGFGGLIN